VAALTAVHHRGELMVRKVATVTPPEAALPAVAPPVPEPIPATLA